MGKVWVYPAADYDYDTVKSSINQILTLSKLEEKIFPGIKVLLKVNLLMKKRPEDAVTTHPLIIRCIAEFLRARGADVVIGDSPAGPFTEKALKGIYQASGMEEAARLSGSILNVDTSFSSVSHPQAIRLKKFDVINVALEADLIISVAKLKTHGMMTFTGAVKNLFGVIPGLTKAEYHFKLTEKENFAYHLMDIERFVKPVFSIIDGIEGMEENGPSNGKKRQVGLIIGGENPYEVDHVASSIIGISPELVPTLYLAEKMSYLDQSEIKVQGIDLNSLKIRPFILPESIDIVFGLTKMPKPLMDFVLGKLKAKPKFIHEQCISCGHCVRNCPAHIIFMDKNNKPKAKLHNCISCFCCHEVCPADAISIKKPLLLKIIQKF